MEPLKKKVRQTVDDNPVRDVLGGRMIEKISHAGDQENRAIRKEKEKSNKGRQTPTRDLEGDTLGMAPPDGHPKDPWR
eukprot:CAMPEP_0206182434 /NCGR_PEP_ID=MMETSP0166-20121206/58_1 /ASSEMBLY_ACC=CAM_ASM_000260 /TAXON_ID=95228 /ORGANISM="Vannella robusta, Strain DIVA3 518/3/11/1/6" /LENGTH=77 /DNA_ID=CAMNT_0053597133 /DNA_START=33 /DNA_END=266 /DNA_ORIENTATION=-